MKNLKKRSFKPEKPVWVIDRVFNDIYGQTWLAIEENGAKIWVLCE